MKIQLQRVPGQTRLGVFQNLIPREREVGGYVCVHLGKLRVTLLCFDVPPDETTVGERGVW